MFKTTSLFTLLAWSILLQAQTTCVVSVDLSQVINPNSKKLLGLSFDARTSMDLDASAGVDPAGYYDPVSGALIQPLWDRSPMGAVRYPGNLVTYNWNWSYTVGPFASRIPQPMGPGGSLSQKLQFGFDEFMAMAQAKGLPASEVQLMVNIYPGIGQPDPAVLNADWVEYCNAPDDGSNPRGGIDWGHLRALNGHSAPYNVRIWNIGNEPWAAGEFGNTTAGADAYMALVSPIIDSMLAADPSILITIPFVGSSASPWNAEIINPAAPTPLLGRIYGLSPHAFYDENTGTQNPGMSQVIPSFASIAGTADALGLSVLAGDHASFTPATDPDQAMRWVGALVTADFLIGISQISNIELANYWIYGNSKAVWHPIRKNADGTYTFMAAAQLYESFWPYFYDQSVSASITNAMGGAVSKTRATAFQNGDHASVIVINTDLMNDNEVIPPAIGGYTLQKVQLLTAGSLMQDTFVTNEAIPLINGHYASPHTSILIFDYAATVLAVEFIEPIKAYPVKDGIQVVWTTASEENVARFEMERSDSGNGFEKIGAIAAQGSSNAIHSYNFKDENPLNGINYYRIKEVDFDGAGQFSRIVAATFYQPYFELYPNPTTGILEYKSDPSPERILIMNNLGTIVKRVVPSSSGLELEDLSPGTYSVVLIFNNGQYSIQKIIKI